MPYLIITDCFKSAQALFGIVRWMWPFLDYKALWAKFFQSLLDLIIIAILIVNNSHSYLTNSFESNLANWHERRWSAVVFNRCSIVYVYYCREIENMFSQNDPLNLSLSWIELGLQLYSKRIQRVIQFNNLWQTNLH